MMMMMIKECISIVESHSCGLFGSPSSWL